VEWTQSDNEQNKQQGGLNVFRKSNYSFKYRRLKKMLISLTLHKTVILVGMELCISWSPQYTHFLEDKTVPAAEAEFNGEMEAVNRQGGLGIGSCLVGGDISAFSLRDVSKPRNIKQSSKKFEPKLFEYKFGVLPSGLHRSARFPHILF
jgi:hypothetical protein